MHRLQMRIILYSVRVRLMQCKKNKMIAFFCKDEQCSLAEFVKVCQFVRSTTTKKVGRPLGGENTAHL